MRKKILAFAMILTLAISAIGCRKESVPQNVNTVTIDGKTVTMKSGDSVEACDTDKKEFEFNGKECSETPVLFNGITLKSTLDDVLEKFDIEPDYAMVWLSLPGEEDENNKLILYKDLDFLKKEHVLAATFIVGYEKRNGQWIKAMYNSSKKGFKPYDKRKNFIEYYISVSGDDEDYNHEDGLKIEKRCVRCIDIQFH